MVYDDYYCEGEVGDEDEEWVRESAQDGAYVGDVCTGRGDLSFAGMNRHGDDVIDFDEFKKAMLADDANQNPNEIQVHMQRQHKRDVSANSPGLGPGRVR